jgi:hypothetical protein
MQRIIWIGLLIILTTGCATYHRIKSNHFFIKAQIESTNFYSELDYELLYGLPVFEVFIDGRSYRFIFDTGGYTVFSEDLIKSLNNIRRVSHIDVKDGNSVTSAIEVYVLDKLEIGGVPFTNIGAAKIGFTESDWFRCLKIDGTIGPNILKECLWLFDNDSRRLILTDDRSRLEIISKGTMVPVRTNNVYKPSLEFDIGGYNGSLGFDTGFNGLLSLKNVKEGAGLQKYPMIEKIGNRSNAGNSTRITNDKLVKLDSINLEGLVLKSIIATSSTIASSNLLGSQIFNYYNVLFDLPERRIYFEQFSELAREAKIESYGFGFDYVDGRIVVGYVYSPGQAMEKGLIPGEVIFKLNGKRLEYSTYCDFIENFKLPDSKFVELELMRDSIPYLMKLPKEVFFLNRQ